MKFDFKVYESLHGALALTFPQNRRRDVDVDVYVYACVYVYVYYVYVCVYVDVDVFFGNFATFFEPWIICTLPSNRTPN